MRIYVASSWRNQMQPQIVDKLRAIGHEVYDFRHPSLNIHGFQWSDIDPEWQRWTVGFYRDALEHPIAERGFNNDFEAMKWADAFVLVMPSGRSAHLEAGWAMGNGKPTCILIPERCEPELMYKLADRIALNVNEVIGWLAGLG